MIRLKITDSNLDSISWTQFEQLEIYLRISRLFDLHGDNIMLHLRKIGDTSKFHRPHRGVFDREGQARQGGIRSTPGALKNAMNVQLERYHHSSVCRQVKRGPRDSALLHLVLYQGIMC